jgi:hypothetical protein
MPAKIVKSRNMKPVIAEKNAVAGTGTFRQTGPSNELFLKKMGERIKVAKIPVDYYYQLHQKLSMCINRNVKR